MKLNNESKTLFIPLLGRAQMSKKDLFLKDLKAEEIIDKVKEFVNKGAKYIVLRTTEFYSIPKLLEIVKEIRK
jgi:O-methyltransferase involved in polyketide biosynthesis